MCMPKFYRYWLSTETYEWDSRRVFKEYAREFVFMRVVMLFICDYQNKILALQCVKIYKLQTLCNKHVIVTYVVSLLGIGIGIDYSLHEAYMHTSLTAGFCWILLCVVNPLCDLFYWILFFLFFFFCFMSDGRWGWEMGGWVVHICIIYHSSILKRCRLLKSLSALNNVRSEAIWCC